MEGVKVLAGMSFVHLRETLMRMQKDGLAERFLRRFLPPFRRRLFLPTQEGRRRRQHRVILRQGCQPHFFLLCPSGGHGDRVQCFDSMVVGGSPGGTSYAALDLSTRRTRWLRLTSLGTETPRTGWSFGSPILAVRWLVVFFPSANL